ncbi:hypothetical protein AURDEDRAFT_111797 [Auricularia subglabra TFB-10046 SS5]|nr:hypothetical protein AURDEDRAFT_111797 [Auricularia subglabra TFB-10046 SS5]
MAPIALLRPSLDVVAAQSTVVRAHDASVAYVDWFASAPLSSTTLRRLATVRLYTSSHDQGWADSRDQGSWTWFEICVASPGPNNTFVIAKRADDTELRWMSHKNEVATPTARRLRGELFDQSHELWLHLREGHVILVRACAQFGSWQNFALEGMLRFRTFFEPVLV